MRARDHEHGHDALDDEGRVVGLEQQPGDQRERGSRERDVEQEGGGAVGEQLGARPARLSFGDEARDAGERGVVAEAGHPHGEGARPVDTSRDDRRPDGRVRPAPTPR